VTPEGQPPNGQSSNGQSPNGQSSNGQPRLGRVLVVDDSEVIRRLITMNLELEGFDVVPATNGQQCLELVHDVAPDVVTLDVQMPELDGFTTAEKLRSDPRTTHLKIAIISAAAQERDLARGRAIGVDAYLTKPFDPDEMVATVRRLAGHPAGHPTD
jgi:CheY-like chemotaxis protein